MLPHRRARTVLGVDLDLTGPGARLGTVLHRALRLRMAQLGSEFRLRVLDNRSDPTVSSDNLASLAADPQVIAAIASTPATMAPAGMPVIAVPAVGGATEPLAGQPELFQLAPDPVAVADRLAAELATAGPTARAATVGLVTVDDPYGDRGARAFVAAAGRHGLAVVVQERVPSGADAQRTALLAAHVARRWPSAVVLWTYPREAGLVAVALRQSGWPGGLLLGAGAADHPRLCGETGQALSGAGIVFTETLAADTLICTSPTRTAGKTWFRDYVAAYGCYDAYASFGADAVDLLLAAFARTGDRGALRDTIEDTQFAGRSGPIRFSATDHSGLDPHALTVLHAVGDRWRLTGSS